MGYRAFVSLVCLVTGTSVTAWLLQSVAIAEEVPLRSAEVSPIGPEFQVNTYTTSDQDHVEIVVRLGGEIVVVWTSSSQDGDGAGIFGQRFEAAGLPEGAEFQINTYTTFSQIIGDVAIADSGEFVVVWWGYQDGESWGIFGQRFDAVGLPAGDEFQVNTYTLRMQRRPFVASDSSGDFVVVWSDYMLDRGCCSGVFGQRFDAYGAPQDIQFQINSYTTGGQAPGDIAMSPDGKFVVVWAGGSDQDGDSGGVFGQRFDPTGTPAGDEFQINSYTTNGQYGPSVAMDSDGNFIVVWMSGGDQDGDSKGVFGQRFDASGTPLGGEFLVNTHTTSDQDGPAVAVDAVGNFVVVWTSEYQDGDSKGVFGQHFDASGTPLGNEFQVNTYTTGSQSGPTVAADGIGGFVVAWESTLQDGDGDGVFGQRFSGPLVYAAPRHVAICQGEIASYTVAVGLGFDPPVTMSASGQPAGTTTTFNPNPVVGPLPAISTFEISDTDTVASGTSTIRVIGTDFVGTQGSADVHLVVQDALPAGAPTLLQPLDGALGQPIQPTLTWSEVLGAVTYTLEVDDDPAFANIDYSHTAVEVTSHHLPISLDHLSDYYWRVQASNPCGDSPYSSIFRFTTVASAAACPNGADAVIHWQDDLESGATGWASGGIGNTWALTGDRTTSGVNAFHAVDPPSGSDQKLMSPAVVLPTGQSPLTLQFQNYQAIEVPAEDGRCYDAGILEISTDSGSSWDQVPGSAMLTDPYNNILWNDDPGNNPIANDYGATDAWCEALGPFVFSVVDLDAWAGQTIQIRWRLGSDSFTGNEGWYLDDVKLQSCERPLIFTDGFESGDTSAWSSTVQ